MIRSWNTTYRFDLELCNNARSFPRRVCDNFMHDRYVMKRVATQANDTKRSSIFADLGSE